MRTRQKILVVNLAGLGDIVLSSPAVKNLKEKFPDDDIFFLTFRDHLECVQGCPYLTGVFALDKRLSVRNARILWQLRKERFDKAVNLYNIHTWRGMLQVWALFSLMNARETFGRDSAGRGFFYRYRHKESGDFERHDSLAMLDTIGLMGANRKQSPFEIWVNDDNRGMDVFFARHNILPGDTVICMHPGAARLSHRWPLKRFALTAEYLAVKYNAKIIVTGGAKDRSLAVCLQKLTAVPLIDACGRFSLVDLKACLKKSRLFVTNDTGPMHMAGVLGTPMAVVAGNSPEAFLPLQTPQTVFLRRKTGKKPGDFEALKDISCFEVFEAADKLLGQAGVPAHPPQDHSGPVKVLHLHTRAIIGGSSANVLLSIEGLPKDQFTGHLACGEKEAQDIFIRQVREKNIPFHSLKHLQNKIHFINDIRAFFEIIALIKKEKYHIVHTHNSKAGVLGRLAAKACGTPLIMHTIHSCEFNYPQANFSQRRFYLAAEKLSALCTDRFIAISEHVKEEFVKYRIAASGRITVIYSGIELDRFGGRGGREFKRRELGFSDGDIVVGVVSRLEKGKGHHTLLRAVPQVLKREKNAKFLFVGDGPLRYELEKFAEDANINGRIIMAGLRTDVADILKSVDIFCCASLYEGMGRAVLEAQASGVPVVANRSGGIPDIVKEGKTAILTEPGSEQSLCEALTALMESESLRRNMGREAARFVDKRFSARTMAKEINRLYGECLVRV